MMESSFMERDSKFSAEFDELVTKTIDHWKVPGLSIAVINGDSTIAQGYGRARLPNEMVTPETLFHCASMTKAFTAAAVSLLVDDNDNYPNVGWTTPVASLLRDDFVLSNNLYTDQVTVEDILSHRTGLPDHDDACLGIHSKTPDTPKSVTRKLRYLPITEDLRTEYQYCNVMYVVACHLVETLTGQSLGDFLRQRIWEPLNMKNTYFGVEDVEKNGQLDQLAKGYRWDEDDGYVDVAWTNQPEGSGAGEMISNVLEFAKFLRSMIRKTGPISEKGHEELVKPRIITEHEPKPFMSYQLYALGWNIDTYQGETIIGHDGGVNGFACKMLYLPRLDWGLVVFGNTLDSWTANEKVCWALIDDLLNIPQEKRLNQDENSKKYIEEAAPKTREQLYPKLPDVSIPLSLPLSAYAGEYRDMGYGSLFISHLDGGLKIDATDRTWRFTLTFEHVSGEFFVVELLDIDTLDVRRMRAEFRLDANGTVKNLGIGFLEGMKHPLIWFQRVMAS